MSSGPSSREKNFMRWQMQQAAEERRLAEERLSEEERKKVEAARKKARIGSRGRVGTLLTSGLGVMGAPQVERKRLLGE